MFTEYLHPQMVLLGQFKNKDIKCMHPYSFKDGEVVVHQSIIRVDKLALFKELMDNREESFGSYDQDQYGYDQDVSEDSVDRDYMKRLVQPDDPILKGYMVYGQKQNQIHPFNQIDSPLGHQFEGPKVPVELIPSQLAQIFGPRQLPRNQGHLFPFPHPQPKQQQDPQQDESWVTEEQEQQYLINEQLEEASGNFATESIE